MYLPMYLALLGCAVTVLLLLPRLRLQQVNLHNGRKKHYTTPEKRSHYSRSAPGEHSNYLRVTRCSSSLGYSVVKATYDALGNVDETVALNGQPFNYSVYQHVAADSTLTNNTDGISPSLYGGVPSVDDVTSGITSTGVTLVGLNFTLDAPLATLFY